LPWILFPTFITSPYSIIFIPYIYQNLAMLLEENIYYPENILTTWIYVHGANISHYDDRIWLYADYGNLLIGETDYICIQTNSGQLKELLKQIDPEFQKGVQYILQEIDHAKTNTQDYSTEFYLEDVEQLAFTELLFCLSRTKEEEIEEEDSIAGTEPEDVSAADENAENDSPFITYQVALYVKNENHLPQFEEDFVTPVIRARKMNLYHNFLSARYFCYKQLKKEMPLDEAKYCSGLADPLIFQLAENYHKVNK
jgi:hypothetical protein